MNELTGEGGREESREDHKSSFIPERGHISILLRSFGLLWNVFRHHQAILQFSMVTYCVSYKFNSILTLST